MITAGVDVGSNTVRLIVAEVNSGKITKILDSRRGITRLGANIEDTGRLSDGGMRKTLELFEIFKKSIVSHGAVRVRAAATSAVREASNANDFISLALELGIPVKAVSGDEEAYYTYLGVSSEIEECPPVLIYDIGGGSTEFIYACDSKIQYSVSIPVGVVKLSDRFGFGKETDAVLHEECRKYISGLISPVYEALKGFKRPLLVGTAGTVTTVAAIDLNMKEYAPSAVSKHLLKKDNLDELLNRISAMPAADRLKINGIDKGREDLVVPGILLIQCIMALYGSEVSNISDSGLREGLAIAAAMEG